MQAEELADRSPRGEAVGLAAPAADGEDDRAVCLGDRLPLRGRVADEDDGALRRVELLAVDREGRSALDDDIELLVSVGSGPDLVVLPDDGLAGLLLVRRAGAERSDVEVRAKPDIDAVVFAPRRRARRSR